MLGVKLTHRQNTQPGNEGEHDKTHKEMQTG